MKNQKSLTLLFLVGIFCMGWSQETAIYTHDEKQYQKALSLYNNHQYQAAQTLFKKVGRSATDSETKANSAYYAANSAIRLNQRGADKLMEEFVVNYPTSTKRNTAYLDVANYYFETGKYPYALKWYKKTNVKGLGAKEQERFNFNNGYANFNSKKIQ